MSAKCRQNENWITLAGRKIIVFVTTKWRAGWDSNPRHSDKKNELELILSHGKGNVPTVW